MGHSVWGLLTRALAVIGGIVLVGIVVRLVGSIFIGVLPPAMALGLAAGFDELGQLIAPALGSVVALGILVATLYVLFGRGRR